jgi:hypothetical protein
VKSVAACRSRIWRGGTITAIAVRFPTLADTVAGIFGADYVDQKGCWE